METGFQALQEEPSSGFRGARTAGACPGLRERVPALRSAQHQGYSSSVSLPQLLSGAKKS